MMGERLWLLALSVTRWQTACETSAKKIRGKESKRRMGRQALILDNALEMIPHRPHRKVLMKYEISKDVLSALHDERVFQNRKWGTIADHPHEVGGYLTLMRKLLTDAEMLWASSRSDDGALSEVRKVVAVGVACMEQHGAVSRSPQDYFRLQGGYVAHSAEGE